MIEDLAPVCNTCSLETYLPKQVINYKSPKSERKPGLPHQLIKWAISARQSRPMFGLGQIWACVSKGVPKN